LKYAVDWTETGREKDDKTDRSGRHTYPVYGLKPDTEGEREVQATHKRTETDGYAYLADRVNPAGKSSKRSVAV